jgi:midasin (ATPase involved in ribosome maturation)
VIFDNCACWKFQTQSLQQKEEYQTHCQYFMLHIVQRAVEAHLLDFRILPYLQTVDCEGRLESMARVTNASVKERQNSELEEKELRCLAHGIAEETMSVIAYV